MSARRLLQIVLFLLIAILVFLPTIGLLNARIDTNRAEDQLKDSNAIIQESVEELSFAHSTRNALEIGGTAEAERALDQYDSQRTEIAKMMDENSALQTAVAGAIEAENQLITQIANQEQIIATLDGVIASYERRITPTPTPQREDDGQSIDYRPAHTEATPEIEITPEITPEPIYKADFDDEIQDEWFVGPVIGAGKTSIEDGVYRIEIDTLSGSIFVTHPPIIRDFRYTATMSVENCEGGISGLLYRATNFETAYMFLVDCDLTAWIAALYDAGDITVLEVQPLPDDLELDDMVNLAVVADGEHIELFINDTSLASIEDEALQAGLIGLYAQTTSEAHDVLIKFDNLLLWELEDEVE